MATIAEERAANARARAEGYESAAHKEMHANVGASAAGYGNAVQQEIDANRRAQAEGFANAAEKEMDANRRSIDAGFTKKNKAGETVPDVLAWKKAGSPKPVDPLDKDRRVFPKRKLVDSFKKGRKIVNRKRGGIIKKPRGWGAARYAGR